MPQSAIRALDKRFTAITHVGERIRCSGTVQEKFEHEGERRVKLRLATANQDGAIKVMGEAVVAWP